MSSIEKSVTQLGKILNDPDKAYQKPHGVKGILAKIFRKTLRERNIGFPQWRLLLDKYTRKLEQETGWPAKSGVRGNLTKALYNENMSMLNFCRGLKFIGVKSFTIKIIAQHDDGTEQVYDSGPVVLDDEDMNVSSFDEEV